MLTLGLFRNLSLVKSIQFTPLPTFFYYYCSRNYCDYANDAFRFIQDKNSPMKYWETERVAEEEKIPEDGVGCRDCTFATPPHFRSEGTVDEKGQVTNSENVKKDVKKMTSVHSTKSAALTHVGSEGKAEMVNVGEKVATDRHAVAEAKVWLGSEVFSLVKENQLRKGDVLSVAQLAGIMGAKATPNLIPLCHPIPLTHIHVKATLEEENYCVRIVSSARTVAGTGVEMEALTGASVAALTVYDMCKAVSHDIVIGDIRLVRKTGGKRDFRR